MASILDAITGVVPAVEIRTAITPPLRVATADDGGQPSPLVKWLRPAVTAFDARGNALVTIAPAGEAGDAEHTAKMALAAGILFAAVVAVFLLGRLSK